MPTEEKHAFDDLARGLATGRVTRRRALQVFAAAAAGGVLSLMGIREASAQPGCRGEGHPCEGNQECCPDLVCRVTGPGNATRCARPLVPPQPVPPQPVPPQPTDGFIVGEGPDVVITGGGGGGGGAGGAGGTGDQFQFQFQNQDQTARAIGPTFDATQTQNVFNRVRQ